MRVQPVAAGAEGRRTPSSRTTTTSGRCPAPSYATCRYAPPTAGPSLFGFGAAAWKTAPRDRFVGWTPERRRRNLPLVVNNARFLILPDTHPQPRRTSSPTSNAASPTTGTAYPPRPARNLLRPRSSPAADFGSTPLDRRTVKEALRDWKSALHVRNPCAALGKLFIRASLAVALEFSLARNFYGVAAYDLDNP